MTVPASGVGNRRDQVLSLARSFLARFFDNEVTGGTDDLTESFFWLIAFLAVPGVFASVWMSWGWGLTATIQGPEALRAISAADKVLYLGFAMIASGVVTAIVWHSLLVDRRDAIVLGALPVSHRVIVQAKLAALAAYVGLVAVSMHVLSSIGFGLFLAAGRGSGFAARGVLAHFVASSAASLFVFTAAIAAQGGVLALVGPRMFNRVSALLQMTLIALVVLGLIALPAMSLGVVDTVQGTGAHVQAWILATPPVWFLGVYEVVLGTTSQTSWKLAQDAFLASVLSSAVAASCYPLAYRRVMRDAVEHPDGVGRIPVAMLARWFPVAIARQGGTRAAVQFMLTSIGRVDRNRFAIALAGGAALAWATPTLVRWRSILDQWSAADQRVVLALPLAAMTFMLVGLRVAVSIPSDLRARWVFHTVDLPRNTLRACVRRVMLALVVVPFAVAAGLSGSALWHARIGLTHAAWCFSLGCLLTEMLVSRVDAMPCAAAWRPEHAKLRTRWPVYLFAFMILCGAGRFSLTGLESYLFQSPAWNAVIAGVLLVAALGVRVVSSNRGELPVEEPETFNAVAVLDLN